MWSSIPIGITIHSWKEGFYYKEHIKQPKKVPLWSFFPLILLLIGPIFLLIGGAQGNPCPFLCCAYDYNYLLIWPHHQLCQSPFLSPHNVILPRTDSYLIPRDFSTKNFLIFNFIVINVIYSFNEDSHFNSAEKLYF